MVMAPIKLPIPRSVYQTAQPQTAMLNAGYTGGTDLRSPSTYPMPATSPFNRTPTWGNNLDMSNAQPEQEAMPNPQQTGIASRNKGTPRQGFQQEQDPSLTSRGAGGAFRYANVPSANLAGVSAALADTSGTVAPDEQTRGALSAGIKGGNRPGKGSVSSDAISSAIGNRKESGGGSGIVTGSSSSGLYASDADGDGDADPVPDGGKGDQKGTAFSEENALGGGVTTATGRHFDAETIQGMADATGLDSSIVQQLLGLVNANVTEIWRDSDGNLQYTFIGPDGEQETGTIGEATLNTATARAKRNQDKAADSKANRDRDEALKILDSISDIDAPEMDQATIDELLASQDARSNMERGRALTLALRLGNDPETMQAQTAGINQQFGVSNMEQAAKTKMQAAVQNLQAKSQEYQARITQLMAQAQLFAGSATAAQAAAIQKDLMNQKKAIDEQLMRYQQQLQRQNQPSFWETLGGIGLGFLGGGLNMLSGGLFGGLSDKIYRGLWD